MTKRKAGFALFWIAVIWAFFWGILASIHQNVFYGRVLTFEEFEQTIWATKRPLINIWGNALPVGVLLAGIGLLLYSGAKGSTAWIFSLGVFLAVVVSLLIGTSGHFPPLFAIGAILILLSFFGILWLWAKERRALQGKSAIAADLKLAGYLFMLSAVWYTCGITGPQWIKAFRDRPPAMDPISVVILFCTGLAIPVPGSLQLAQAKRSTGVRWPRLMTCRIVWLPAWHAPFQPGRRSSGWPFRRARLSEAIVQRRCLADPWAGITRHAARRRKTPSTAG